MKVLGILGGIGPESTGHLYREIVEKFQQEFQPKDNTSYPHILINSIPARDLIETTSGDALLEYKEGLRALERWGAELIMIACNGAYCFFDALQETVSVPIINARESVERSLRTSNAKEVLILASPTSIKHGLYRFPFVKNIGLTEEEIASLGKAITAYNLGHKKEASQKYIIKRSAEAMSEGQTVLAGCTEIHAMLDTAGIKHIDPMSSMIDTLFNEWRMPPFGIKRKSPIHGQGIFAVQRIAAGASFYTLPQAHVSKTPVDRWAHFQGKWYDDPIFLNFVNHSCEPNIEITSHDGNITLDALREIIPGEELVCDYNRTEVGGKLILCHCNMSACRKTFQIIKS